MKAKTMKKADLIKYLSDHAEVTRTQAETVLNTLTNCILDTVRADGEFVLPDVGKFGSSERAARKGRNPSNGEEITIAAKRVPKFSAAKALRDAAST